MSRRKDLTFFEKSPQQYFDDYLLSREEEKNWTALKNRWIAQDRAMMASLLDCRKSHVLGMIELVIAQTHYSAHAKYNATGSTNLTSDYDVQIYDDGSLLADPGEIIAKFNQLFLDRYKKTAATLLDTNLYDPSYRLPRGDASENSEITQSEQRVVKANDVNMDIGALAKIRRYADDAIWSRFRLDVASNGERFSAAEELVRSFREIISGSRDDDERMQRTNIKYVELLKVVQTYRAEQLAQLNKLKNPAIPTEKAQILRSLDAATLGRKRAMMEATIYADEAYHSEGPMIDVVRNQQGVLKYIHHGEDGNVERDYTEETSLGPDFDADLDRRLLRKYVRSPEGKWVLVQQTPEQKKQSLSLNEKLQSFNEQFGDALKDIGHFIGHQADNISFVKLSKYIKRMISIGKSLGTDVTPTTEKITRIMAFFAELEPINDALYKLRSGGEPADATLVGRLKTVGISDLGTYRKKVLEIAQGVNGFVRASSLF